MTEDRLQKNPFPLGACKEGKGVRFSFVSGAAHCGILLYDRITGKKLNKIPFVREDRIGKVYCKTLKECDADSVSWLFYEEDRIVPDERGRAFPERASYGKEEKMERLKAAFVKDGYDWEGDHFPKIPYNEAVVYCLHVRGFTKHSSSHVRHGGTFAGIVEKIPYLKEIGITTLEVQPAYEFTEIPLPEEYRNGAFYGNYGNGGMGDPGAAVKIFGDDLSREKKLNYWGYKKGYYYAPKAAYAASGDPSAEFKSLVKALHENGMELVMQFYFPKEVKRSEILEILHFWVLEYHVDGFHLMGEELMADMLAADDLLADTKLWYYQFDTGGIYGWREEPLGPHAAEYNDSWYYDMRRFLKGDGGMLESVLYHMRHIPSKAGDIHYLTNYYGFTLADLVSYDRKHNEANGEENRDGNDYNCSWNCGEEGPTRKKKIRQLRTKQMKNAMCMLLLAQSTPLIFMGDEFGNSQKGNNNPYCQDNAVTWLDWGGAEKNAGLLDFWKMLAAFRKQNPILHPEKELRLMDYIACGYPDLSYHGENAWRAQTENSYRHVGIMLCGKYAGENREDPFLYLAFNMDWVSHELALPRLPRGMEWKAAFSTGEESDRWQHRERTLLAEGESLSEEEPGENGGRDPEGKPSLKKTAFAKSFIAPRSVKVYVGSREMP